MSSRPLHPDVALGIRISTVMSRNQFEADPAAATVVDELFATGGDRVYLLTESCPTRLA